MLTDLLISAGVPTPHPDVFNLEGTEYHTALRYFQRDVPIIVPEHDSYYLFQLRAWTQGGHALFMRVEFGFTSPDRLQICYRDMRTPCDRKGDPLQGMVNLATDKRIINRLRARELLK